MKMQKRRPLPALRLSLLAALGLAGCDDEADPPDLGFPSEIGPYDRGAIDATLPDGSSADEGSADTGADTGSDMASGDMAAGDMASGDMASPDMAPGDMAPGDMATPDMASPDMAAPDMAAPDQGMPSACANPQAVLDPDGDPTGVVRCADDSMHREATAVCDPTIDLPACDGGGEDGSECQNDSDCDAGPHGRCIQVPLLGGQGVAFCGCRYGCATDDDCADGSVCICPGVIDGNSYCAPADCTTSDDCESGECGINATSDGCSYTVQVACREPDVDACRTNRDCMNAGMGDGCGVDGEGDWMCQFLPVCGRPLTVAGAPRTAPAAARADWATIGAPATPRSRRDLPGLRDALLAVLG